MQLNLMADIREIKVINRVYVKSNHARRVMASAY